MAKSVGGVMDIVERLRDSDNDEEYVSPVSTEKRLTLPWEAAAEITKLREENNRFFLMANDESFKVAALEEEVGRLKEEVKSEQRWASFYAQESHSRQATIEEYQAQLLGKAEQLVTAQLAAKKMREALKECDAALEECRDYPVTHDMVIEALSVHIDTSAVDELVRDAERYRWLRQNSNKENYCLLCGYDGLDCWEAGDLDLQIDAAKLQSNEQGEG